MINLINGSLKDPQENITWTENKPSAIIYLNTHDFRVGEVLVVGYESERGRKDIMVALGISYGMGPQCYRILTDESVIIVTEVLDHVPDVSYYVFDQRYLVSGKQRYFLTRRYHNNITGNVVVENIEIEDPCIIKETSTGLIWICQPPSLINLFDLTTKSTVNEVTDAIGGGATISLTSNGQTKEDLCLITPDEKSWLASSVFNQDFQVTQTVTKYDSLGGHTTSVDPCVVSRLLYTLTAEYKGEPVDLDSIPGGWTHEKTGVYTKNIKGNIPPTPEDVECVLTIGNMTGRKIAKGISAEVYMYSFIVYLQSQPEPEYLAHTGSKYLTETSKLGDISITPPQDFYTWFCFPSSSRPSRIKQLGMNYVSPDIVSIGEVVRSGVSLGEYVAYRSLNPGNGEPQDIVIE